MNQPISLRILSMLALATAAAACSAEAEEPLVEESEEAAKVAPSKPTVYDSGRRAYGMDGLNQAFAAVTEGRPDNVIVYVHGRGCGGGGEPKKSLDGVVPAMEKDYTGKVLMFYWPGSASGCPLGFPESRARAAGPAFAGLMSSLAAFKADHAAELSGTKFVLLTHSMGGLVLESATAESGVESLPKDLFASVVVNASATSLKGHDVWERRLTFGERVYVTENGNDSVLKSAAITEGARLGKSLGKSKLASRTTYVDFTANHVDHAYFVAGGQFGDAMKAFYRAVMDGDTFDFEKSPGVRDKTTRDGATIWTFNGK